MKAMLTAVAAIAFLCIAGPSPAEQTLVYPADNPVLSIGFPDAWKLKPDPDYDRGIIVTSPDEEIEIDLWALEDEEVRADPARAIEFSVEEVRTIVREWVAIKEIGPPEMATYNGIRFFRREGVGTSREDGSAVNVSVYFFSPDQKTIFVLMYWGSDAGEKKYAKQLEAIAQSVKRP